MPSQDPVIFEHQPQRRPWWTLALVALVIAVLAVAIWLLWPGGTPEKLAYCSGEDVSTTQHRSVEDFNASSAAEGAKAKLLESPRTAEAQRAEYFERIADGGCDVIYLDVIYTPEFASKGLLRDMTPFVRAGGHEETFDENMLQTALYDGKYWGVPKQLDGGVIFYRTSDGAPATWREILERSIPKGNEKPGLRFQLSAFEGLTVVFLELAYAAGAQPIVSPDLKSAQISQRGTLEALQFLREALQRGAAPRSVLRTGDAGSFYSFSIRRAHYLRSWPYVEKRFLPEAELAAQNHSSVAETRFRTARHHGVAPLPPWQRGGEHVGILGGHHLVIPKSSKHPEAAQRLVEFLAGRDQILKDAKQGSLVPVLTQLRNDPDVQRDPALQAVYETRLVPRPITPRYARISRAIYDELRRALSSDRSDLQAALRRIDAEVQAILDEP